MYDWRVGLLIGCGLLVSCSTLSLGPPQPSLTNIEVVRAAQFGQVRVGTFTLASGLPTAMDKVHMVRTNSVVAPQGSFAAYLGETLRAELRGAGRYSEDAATTVNGQLLDSDLRGGMAPTNSARLSARFEVVRDGAIAYRREISVEDQWESVYLGVIAVPASINHYTELHRKIVGVLLKDPEFAKATRGP
jgi:hypothetical protein